MGRKAKSVDMQNAHLTKDEINERKKGEEKLKGKSDKLETPPSWLSKNAKKEYKKLYNDIKDMNIFSNLDGEALSNVALCRDKVKECEKIIAEEGLMIDVFKKDRTYKQENPMIKVQLKYLEMLKKYEKELEIFSPSGRAKLTLAKIQSGDKSDDPLLKALAEDEDDEE